MTELQKVINDLNVQNAEANRAMQKITDEWDKTIKSLSEAIKPPFEDLDKAVKPLSEDLEKIAMQIKDCGLGLNMQNIINDSVMDSVRIHTLNMNKISNIGTTGVGHSISRNFVYKDMSEFFH